MWKRATNLRKLSFICEVFLFINLKQSLMLKSVIISLCTLLIVACKPKADADTAEKTSSGVTSPAAAPKSDLKDLEKAAGKKPSEIKFFETYNLYPRLEKMLGKEYASFKADWNTESAIEYDGEVAYFYGCKKDKCTDNRYFILIDKTLNTINVYNFKGSNTRAYEEEKNVIGMSDKISSYFESIRKEHGGM